MPPLHLPHLLSVPGPLRALLISHLRPIPPRRLATISNAPSRHASSEPSKDVLWTSPRITIRPPTSLIHEPPSPEDHAAATTFFLGRPPPEFAYSATTWRAHAVNAHTPELLVIGCSNAGKSTLINALLGVSDLARSSAHPGSTRAMNAYLCGPVVARRAELEDANNGGKGKGKGAARPRIDGTRSLVLMDTPGYGFNSVREWGEEIEKYIERRKMLRGVVLLLRGDVPLSRLDGDVLAWVKESGKRTVVVLTRADRCEEAWQDTCLGRYGQVRALLGKQQGEGWLVPEVYITAAGMRDAGDWTKGRKSEGSRDEAGLVGARIALLRLAGLMEEETVKGSEPKARAWVGKTVSFDDIPVKGGSFG